MAGAVQADGASRRGPCTLAPGMQGMRMATPNRRTGMLPMKAPILLASLILLSSACATPQPTAGGRVERIAIFDEVRLAASGSEAGSCTFLHREPDVAAVLAHARHDSVESWNEVRGGDALEGLGIEVRAGAGKTIMVTVMIVEGRCREFEAYWLLE